MAGNLPSEWSLQNLALHLGHAEIGLNNNNQTREKHTVLTGACAIWIHAFSPQLNSDNDPPEVEVLKMLTELTFPRYYIRYLFHVQVQGLRVHTNQINTESFDLNDREGNWLAILELMFSGNTVSSHPISFDDHRQVQVAKGIWIGFDLLLAFFRCSIDVVESNAPSELSVRARMIVETAAATFSLLLHSLTRLAQHRSSLDLLGFDKYRHSGEYDTVRTASMFELYAPAVEWFAHYGGTARLSQLAAKYYYARLQNQDGQQGTNRDRHLLASEIQISLEYWQTGFKKLVPTPSRSLQLIVNGPSLPDHLRKIAELLSHQDFGLEPPPPYHTAVHGQFSADSPWVPIYPGGTPSRGSSPSGSTLTLREPGSLAPSRAPSPYSPYSPSSRRGSNQ